MTSLEEAKKIAEVLDNKKAQEVKVLKVADLTFVAEYFVLATGTSNTQVKSLAEEVEFQMKEAGLPGHLEGKASDWYLIDFGSVICHIFEPDARAHYNLERLWADAEEISL
ncbi:MAG: ribosome silencing factor [Clostridia bacterium]|nr:ribosome silencing factor [Clostridia bacterium]MBO7689303.1 ribosome silencing factor [Clostridia bacterium]MBP5273079.1 ribosome silencing factor [Clostridia bacterium]MBP5459690.1 ribosome silencing factor [Clostridia bacterium]